MGGVAGRGSNEGLGRVEEVKNYKGLVSVNAIKPAVSASWQLLKRGCYPPTDTGRQRPYPSFPTIPFQRNGFQAREKDPPECRRRIYISKGQRLDLQLVNALR